MEKIIIAIDGHSACGKSSTAKAVARELGYIYIDSGAMYRAVTLYFLQNNISETDPLQVEQALEDINISFKNTSEGNQTFLNGVNVEKEIRDMAVTNHVSHVSAIPAVRKAMVAQQRRMSEQKGVVMDGRDIGTVVFPNAELKIFMTADFDIRAERRRQELLEKNIVVDFEEVKKNLVKRDELDSTRENSPLIQDSQAVVIDNSHLTFEEQVEKVVSLAKQKVFAE